jgi:hypothetical protein
MTVYQKRSLVSESPFIFSCVTKDEDTGHRLLSLLRDTISRLLTVLVSLSLEEENHGKRMID